MASDTQNNKPFNIGSFLTSPGTGRATLRLKSGATLFTQGEKADAVYYLYEGKAKASVAAVNGKEAVLAIYNPGDFCGEISLLGETKRTASVSALTDIVAVRIDKNAMHTIIHEHEELADYLIEHLLRRKQRVEDDLIDQLSNLSEKRFARTLLLLADETDTLDLTLSKISQETLAEMVGTTRSRISHFMTKFRRLGMIEDKDEIRINSALIRSMLANSDDQLFASERGKNAEPELTRKPARKVRSE